MLILGLDPGFASLGWARLRLVGGGEQVVDCGVLRTTKSVKKRNTLATDDNVRRCRELYLGIDRLVTKDVIVLATESQSWPRSSSVVAKVGQAWGVIAAIAARYDLPVIQCSPQRLKLVLAGSKSASKRAVQRALERRYGTITWPKQKGLHEHCADALGAAVVALGSDHIRLAKRLKNEEVRK